MTAQPLFPKMKISALVSDVDGTLVTDDKILTLRTQAAVAALRARGITFTIISSRPPRGLRMLLDRLQIKAPIGCFNGGVIANPDLSVITEHLLEADVARRAVDMLDAHGVQSWVFAGQDWLVRNVDGPYMQREERAVGFPPTIVEDFGSSLDVAAKIVGVSPDFALLARCERNVRIALANHASAARSQPYYLDITHPLADKGAALVEIANRLSIPAREVAVIGDGGNDISMFERSGLSIAMGNAALEVRGAADFLTDRNCEEGFANAIERIILGRPDANGEMARRGHRAC